MKAVILASGIGKRFQPFTLTKPKQLAELHEETILDRILKSLLQNNINNLVITTGHLEKKIRQFIDRNPNYKKFSIQYVFNPKFSETNYIYSMWVARKEILGNDIILLHGDMVYDYKLMKKVVKENKSSAMVNIEIPVPEKDFKARLKNGRIIEIGTKIFDEDCFAFMPIYKLMQKDVKLWFERIGAFIKRGETSVYAENAFNEISDKLLLYPLYYTSETCMEVDNYEDLEKAKKLLNK